MQCRHRLDISRRGVNVQLNKAATRSRARESAIVIGAWSRGRVYEFFLYDNVSRDFRTYALFNAPGNSSQILCVRLLQSFDFVVYPPEHAVSFVGMFWWVHCQDETLHALRDVDSIRLQPRRPTHEPLKEKHHPFS